MYNSGNTARRPRNGHTWVIGIVAHISGCANQKEMSLDDQIDHAEEVAREYFEGPIEFRIIRTVGKGEELDRPKLAQIESEFRSAEMDACLFEDLGRLICGGEAAWLLGIAKDHGTRVLVPNDCIDTDDETWEEDALSACSAHVKNNAHTSKRLKQKMLNRFVKFGGSLPRPIYGYLLPPDAKTTT